MKNNQPHQNIFQSDDLQEQINYVADQLCLAVKGEFDFLIDLNSATESMQKLTMLINFLLDSARRSLASIREKNDKLTELDRLKSDFVANISHELRTPLTLILGPLEGILANPDLSLSGQHRADLQRIYRNAGRLYSLVNNLLDFSKVDAGKIVVNPEPLNLNDFLENLIHDIQGLAHERGIHLTFSGCNTLSTSLHDPKIIEKIVLNLVSNALKFTPKDGYVSVYLEQEGNEHVKLMIKDSGIGIAPEHINRIFERFHQIDSSASRTHAGTGIGLALVHQFVHIIGGSVHVISNIGQGSLFIITLPLNPTDTPIIQKKNTASKVSQPLLHLEHQDSGITELDEIIIKGDFPLILVADDSIEIQSYIKSLLQDSYEIISVPNGKLALDAIIKYQPQIILSDVMMPIMGGYELTKSVKNDPKINHIPIILITARAGNNELVNGLDIGADGYLAKPFSPEELKARIASALRLAQNHNMKLRENFNKIDEMNRELKKVIHELSESRQTLITANAMMAAEIDERKKLEQQNNELNEQLIMAARRAGMAEIATSVLHNVGNVLNSANTAVSMIGKKINSTKISHISEISTLLESNQNNIYAFFEQDPRGQRIPGYLIKLSQAWTSDKTYLLGEVKILEHSIHHIKEIIAKQNCYSRVLGLDEEIIIRDLIQDSMILNRSMIEKEGVDISCECDEGLKIFTDRVKLLQVMVNLIKNSIESVAENNTTLKKIIIRAALEADGFFDIRVQDNGIGIAPENLSKMFSYGFTTKKNGHGFGLHTCALAIKEIEGDLSVSSPGVGQGATFKIILPQKNNTLQDAHTEKQNIPPERSHHATS